MWTGSSSCPSKHVPWCLPSCRYISVTSKSFTRSTCISREMQLNWWAKTKCFEGRGVNGAWNCERLRKIAKDCVVLQNIARDCTRLRNMAKVCERLKEIARVRLRKMFVCDYQVFASARYHNGDVICVCVICSHSSHCLYQL